MTAAFKFAHLSDSHVRPDVVGAQQVFIDHLAQIRAGDCDFVIHTGDLMDEPSAWAARAFGAVTSHLQIPIHVVPGNHDVYNPNLGGIPAPWWARLEVDSGLEAQYRGWFGPSWYTFDHKGASFVAFDSLIINSGLPEEPAQWRWLEETLTGLAARQPGQIFMFTHLPLFIRDPYERLDLTDFRNRYLVIAPPGRDRLLDLIRNHQVSAVFSGHTHAPWETAHSWPEGFTTRFITSGSSGPMSPMAIDQFDLPLTPAQGLGYYEHAVDRDSLTSRYSLHEPEQDLGQWVLGRTWTTQCPPGRTPSPRRGLQWHEPGFSPPAPEWQTSTPASPFSLAAEEKATYCVRQAFIAETAAVAMYLRVCSERAVEIYLNGESLYSITSLQNRPPAWQSAGGRYTVDSPVLCLALNQRLVRRGENVIALRVDGERAVDPAANGEAYIAFCELAGMEEGNL
jgi:3',5'-cyclic AMP phosphodiesterase CpdA